MSSKPDDQPSVRVEINQGIVANRIETLHVHSPPVQAYERQVVDYYRKVAKACRIATMDDHHPAGCESLPAESAVAQVYVEPDVWKVTIPPTADEKSERPAVQQEQPEHRERLKWQSCFDSTEEGLRQLLLVADGGMGKTTAVDVQIQRLVDKGDIPWMALRLPRVLVVGSKVGDDDVVEVALTYDIAGKLDLAASQAEAVAHEVLNRLDKQAGVILLDALDEVPQSERRRVVAGVLRFLNRLLFRQPYHKVVITSRAYAVEGGAVGSDLAKAGFVRLELARLSKDQRTELVQKYFAVRGRDAQVGAALLRQLAASDTGGIAAMGELMREPMLATYACMLAEARSYEAGEVASKEPLPTTRHELFEGVVHLLLERWDGKRRDSEQTRGFEELFLADKDLGRSRLRHVLEQAAVQEHLHAAQVDAARKSDAPLPDSDEFPIPEDLNLDALYEAAYQGDAHEALGADWLIARIDEQMREDMPLRAHHIYTWLTRRSGLLGLELDALGRARPRVHRQLGDFLAAAGLWGANSEASDYASELVQRLQVSPDWSRDLVAQGWERLVASAKGDPRKFVPILTTALTEWEEWCESVNQQDSEAGTTAFVLALARALPGEWLAVHLPLNAALQDLRQRLVTILAEQRLSAPERANAADALGALGDPRFAPGLWLPRERYRVNTEINEPLPGFVRVPVGPFWIGEGGIEDNPLREVTIESDFYIARCLTTVAQYRRFVDAGAYGGWSADKDAEIWAASGLAWRQTAGAEGQPLRQTRCWADQLASPHRPVVNVSWWEARAYARWLNADPAWQRTQGAVKAFAGLRVCLPTEVQWERAARLDTLGGSHRHRWPWGDEPYNLGERANISESGVGRVSVVGCFAPNSFGIWDIAGNAWEWMDNAWEDTSNVPWGRTAADETANLPALRGGAWNLSAENVRASVRGRDHPDNWDDGVGFRVVLSLAEWNPDT